MVHVCTDWNWLLVFGYSVGRDGGVVSVVSERLLVEVVVDGLVSGVRVVDVIVVL